MVPKAAVTLVVAFSAVLAAAAATTNKRIIGGEVAKEGDFPFIVRLQYGDDTSILCGGTLLDSITVLTAAHCNLKDITSVRAGSLDKDTGGVVAQVGSRLRHPDYVLNGHHNDIAILKLSTPIQASQTIGYAKLPASGLNPVIGSTAVAAGWGSTVELLGTVSDKLRRVTLPVDAPDECFDLEIDAGKGFQNHLDTRVCAGERGKDTGRGDSGGPLIDQETRQLIGVTSSVPLGAQYGRGFYTRVSSFIPWINQNLGDSGIDPRRVTGYM
ncbi:Trypsin [Metarhizium brunneum]|uniref:Trypsin n=1 Tax=Metarhizium brunneum TaxID=500148 RepID=A0A7D5Z9N9_9HYPO|nr:Trypsin [Metarhizium brunneum]